MNWQSFLSGMFEDGRLVMPPFAPLRAEDLAELRAVLEPYEQVARLSHPDGLPVWDAEAGSWAGAMLFRACQFIVFRELDETTIKHQLTGDEPPPTASAHYSIDLCFRYLPDVTAFARSASEQDPLVIQLGQWAQNWPLSSVGMPHIEVNTERLTGVLSSPGLQRIYVDRILAADDDTRLADSQVFDAVRATLGDHMELAPPRIRRCLHHRMNAVSDEPSDKPPSSEA